MKLYRKNRQLTIAVAASTALFFAVPFVSQGQDIPITTKSAEARAYFDKGEVAMDNAQPIEARENFDKAIALDSMFAMAYLQRAPAGESFEKILAYLAKAEALKQAVSPAEQLYIDIMAADYRSGDISKREEMTDRLLAMYPSSDRALYAAATVAGTKGDKKKQIEYLLKIASLYPKKGNVYNALGYVRASMQDLEGAEKDFRRYTELSPMVANSHDSYAEVLMMLGRHQESIAEYEKALQIDPNFLSALGGIGNNYLFLEDYPKARDYYRQVYGKAKDIRDSLRADFGTAMSYMYEGNIDEAAKTLNDVYERYKVENGIAGLSSLNTIALYYLGVGKTAEALSWIDKCRLAADHMTLDSGMRDQFALADLLHRTWYFAASGQTAESKAEAEKLRVLAGKIQDQGASNMYHHAMGIMELYAGNPSEALAHLDKADSTNEFVMYHKAQVLEKLRRQAEARALYQKAAALRNNNAGLAVVHRLAMDAMRREATQAGQ